MCAFWKHINALLHFQEQFKRPKHLWIRSRDSANVVFKKLSVTRGLKADQLVVIFKSCFNCIVPVLPSISRCHIQQLFHFDTGLQALVTTWLIVVNVTGVSITTNVFKHTSFIFSCPNNTGWPQIIFNILNVYEDKIRNDIFMGLGLFFKNMC